MVVAVHDPDDDSDWHHHLSAPAETILEIRRELARQLQPTPAGSSQTTAEFDQVAAALASLADAADADPEAYATLYEHLAALQRAFDAQQAGVGGWAQLLDRARQELAALRMLDPEEFPRGVD